jgi:hypothetical protein
MKALASKEMVQSVQEKFQFLAVITLFFPVTLQAVFAVFEETVRANYQVVSWGVLVAVLIFDYLLIDYLKEKMPVPVARYTEIFITLSILCYVPIFLVFAMFSQPVIPFLYGIAMGVGVEGSMLIPLLIFALLSVTTVYLILREELTWTYKPIVNLLSRLYGRGAKE